jgi:DNA polymerase-3 subunit alpha
MAGFTHLHLHTQYSLLDGAIHMDRLCPKVKAQGMDKVAVTDHGNMFGALHFYTQAKKHGVKPIFGMEAYVAGPKGMRDRTERQTRHLVLLAKNNEGYKNLSYLVSMSYMEGFYYKPRIDVELLRKHSQGLYGLSACLGGVVNKPLLRAGESEAAIAAKEFKGIFAPGHFFLELQDNGLDDQPRANQALLNLGELLDIPVACTADAHYLEPEDSDAHEILMCIGQGDTLEQFRKRRHKHSDRLWVRSPDDMWRDFQRLAPKAVENTERIAQDCNVELALGNLMLPRYGVPSGFTRDSYIEKLAAEGLQQRLLEVRHAASPARYKERLEYELGIITRMGFSGYFLIVADFIGFAKKSGIPVGPGRGSGAGSVVAWALGITDLDPIALNLIFERFLNPERVSMPDFDIDFCMDRRGEVIDYVANKYGQQNVAQIVTYSQLSAKSGIKDVSRVMGLPFAETNAITKLIPSLMNGKKVSIEQALQLEPKLRDLCNDKPQFKQVIDITRSLEGLNRQTGIHAAGIVIADEPIWNYVPVCRGKDGEMVTQFAKDEVEQAGLVKFDFLGLKTLTVIAGAIAHVRHLPEHGAFDFKHIPYDDPEVYRLIAKGDTDGVFQMESSGFKELLARLKPDRFEDIVAAGALYRPGPLEAGVVDDYIDRKHGRKKVEYPHPTCEAVLEPTYGTIVYQEQVMRIAVDLCGFSMGEADVLRKAMGKKKAEVMAQMRTQFVEGAHRNSSMATKAADELFTLIEKFAGYAFCKSHSAAYAVITYQTAYLKAHFPVQFMAALLSTEMRSQDNVVRYMQSAREHAMRILPPCVQRSERDFTVVPDAGKPTILFGLGAVKGVGDAAIGSVLEARAGGDFASIYDFCARVDLKRVNRKVLDALVKSGAFDSFGRDRAQILMTLDRALESGQRAQRDRLSGQTSLFAMIASPPSVAKAGSTETYADVPPWSKKQRLQHEKDAVGYYISGHPLDGYWQDLPRLTTATTADLAQMATDRRFQEVALAGVVGQYKDRPLKNGKGRMAFITLEDLVGSCDVLVFSKVFDAAEAVLKGDEPILVRGTIIVEGDEQNQFKVRATSIQLLSEVRAQGARLFQVRLPMSLVDEQRLGRLRELLIAYRGSVPAHITFVQPQYFEAELRLPEYLKVNPTDELCAEVDRVFGDGVVRLA